MILIHFVLLHKELCYVHKYVIVIHYYLQDANIWCHYYKEKGPIPWPCCDLRGCARLAKMDAGHWWLPKAISNQEGKTKGTKKISWLRPSQTLRPTYRLWWHDGKTWMSYMLYTTSSKTNIDYFIINHCSDPCLQNVHNIFFLRNRWIAFFIKPKPGKILIYDSLDWETKRYEEFLKIIQLWVNFLLYFHACHV